MSIRCHRKARLSGWDGPYFTDASRRLLLLIGQPICLGWNRNLLNLFALMVRGFVDSETVGGIFTSDGYHWFHQLTYKANGTNGELAILIPYMKDEGRHSDTPADRAVALHTKNMSISEADRIIEEMIVMIEHIIAINEAINV